MKRLALLSLISLSTHAQNFGYLAGARSAALSHSSVSIEDIWASFHNQAALAFLEKRQMAISYESLYFIKELANGHFSYIQPTSDGCLGFNLNYFGSSLFNQSKFGFSYSRPFGKFWSLGLQINYENLFVEQGSQNGGLITTEIGLLAKPNAKLNFGFHVYNPTRENRSIENVKEHPLIVRIGSRYSLSQKALLSAELRKQLEYTEQFAFGFEYRFGNALAFRTGIQLPNTCNSFGLGLGWSQFLLDLAYTYSNTLGNRLIFSFQFKLK